MESDVVRELLSATSQGGGDSQEEWRAEAIGGADGSFILHLHAGSFGIAVPFEQATVVDFLMTLAPESVTHKAFLHELVVLSLLYKRCSDVMMGKLSDRARFSFGIVIFAPLRSLGGVPSVEGQLYGAWLSPQG